MRKLIGVLLLSGIFLFSSGFGAVENNTHVKTEVQSIENKQSVKKDSEENLIESKLQKEVVREPSESFSTKVGKIIVSAFLFVIKSIAAFFVNLIHG